MTHITCRMTVKNRDQLRDPTIGNRLWATFTFFHYSHYYCWTGAEAAESAGGRSSTGGRRRRMSGSRSRQPSEDDRDNDPAAATSAAGDHQGSSPPPGAPHPGRHGGRRTAADSRPGGKQTLSPSSFDDEAPAQVSPLQVN